MKGPKELKRLFALSKKYLKAIHYDSLLLFKLQKKDNHKKYQERNVPRDKDY